MQCCLYLLCEQLKDWMKSTDHVQAPIAMCFVSHQTVSKADVSIQVAGHTHGSPAASS